MENYKKILNEVKQKFSSLKKEKVRLRLVEIKSTGRAFSFPFLGYEIWIDPSKCKKMGHNELIGLFAHELVHIEQYKNEKISFYGLILQIEKIFSKKIFEREITKIERAADKDTIRYGFGKELLALRKYTIKTHSKGYYKKTKMRYMSPEEIRKLMR